MLRQQMRPEERVHGCILEAPRVTNVIPGCANVGYGVRSPTMGATRRLGDKVRRCFEAAGLAAGCVVSIEE
jgi:metal-dependent amidase/aminoacylase/carboxypeptidase family protein